MGFVLGVVLFFLVLNIFFIVGLLVCGIWLIVKIIFFYGFWEFYMFV